MEMLLAALLFLAIILGVLFYLFLKAKKTANQYKNELVTVEKEFHKLQQKEEKLKAETQTLQGKLEHTFKDSVTNLLGWQLFEDRLSQNIKESTRYQFTMAVMYIDIDDFKVINNALSGEVGDALLYEVAERLKTCIRQVDSISRFNKDTFVVLLTQLAKPETAAVVAQRILQTLAQPFQIKNYELYITVAIGISIYPSDGQDVVSLLQNADQALQLAKNKGKHLYQFYQEALHTKSQRELSLYMHLNRESIFQEFAIYYQPIVNVKTESIVCMDALLYWQHEELGLIDSVELFQYAEKQRKLNLISEWVLQNACKQFLYWRTLGFYPEMLGISISIKQLENSHFIYRISQIMQTLEFKPEWLLLEIKESIAEISFETLEKAFNMLKYIGVKIAIDNFGSGTFSLRFLKIFSIHYIKLDRTLVDDISANTQTVELFKSLCQLATNLNIQMIVQGIESDDQIKILKDLGCILLQGQLLGAPLSEREVTDKMKVAPG